MKQSVRSRAVGSLTERWRFHDWDHALTPTSPQNDYTLTKEDYHLHSIKIGMIISDPAY